MRATSSSAVLASTLLFSLPVCPGEPENEQVLFKLTAPKQVFNGEVFGPGAREANPKHWRATFMLSEPGGEDCTATAVAADVILTAAHCLTKTLQGTMAAGNRSVSCTRHDQWKVGPEADFALCVVDPPFAATAAGFEVIGTDENRPPVPATITLLGFGCRMAGGIDHGYGTLARGDATAVSMSDAYLETAGNATICPGDSGGGAFWAEDQAGIRRRLVAVNSSTDLKEMSRLSRTSNPDFLRWARAWRDAHGKKLCGLDPDATPCHQ